MVATETDEFDTLKDLVAAGRKRDGTALDIVRRPAPYSYHDFCTNVWKAANLLGHYGVHAVGEMAVELGPKSTESPQSGNSSIDASEPLLAVLGGSILGSTVDLTPTEPVDGPVLVAPAHGMLEVTPSCSRLAYGGPPTDPDVSHFERAVWSENPIEPPERVTPDQEALRFGETAWTHAELLDIVEKLIEKHDVGPTSRVVLRAPLTEPGGFVAGVLLPLAAGGAIVVPETTTEESPSSAEIDSTDDTIVLTPAESSDGVVSATDVTHLMRDAHRI